MRYSVSTVYGEKEFSMQSEYAVCVCVWVGMRVCVCVCVWGETLDLDDAAHIIGLDLLGRGKMLQRLWHFGAPGHDYSQHLLRRLSRHHVAVTNDLSASSSALDPNAFEQQRQTHSRSELSNSLVDDPLVV